MNAARSPAPRRVFVAGASGAIGRAVVRTLVDRGHAVVCLVRPSSLAGGSAADVGASPAARGASTDSAPTRADAPTAPPVANGLARCLAGATVRTGDVADPRSLARDGFSGERFDAVVSCLASRTGVAADAWAIDHGATVQVFNAARRAGARQGVLVSAICVQKPVLAFQHAKLAAEQALAVSGLAWTVVRPTAFFRSLSGQVARVRDGKPFLVFGDGRLTACKPISDADLADFVADCLDDPGRRDRVLPIGGPGDAIAPLDQAAMLARLLGRPVPVRRVPVALLEGAAALLGLGARMVPGLAAKAELARIGRYYATESMLVLDPATGRYDAAATPSTGRETLDGYYASLLRGETVLERGAHAVFEATGADARTAVPAATARDPSRPDR